MRGSPLADLERHARRIWGLERALELAVWDQRTMMPPGGAEARSHVMAALARAAHDCWTAPALGHLLADLSEFDQANEHDSDAASLIRVVRREHERRIAVPASLFEERAQAAAAAYAVWVEARTSARFDDFASALERNVTLARSYASCFDGDEPYDSLIGEFDPGITTADLRRLFDVLRPELTRLLQVAAPGRPQVIAPSVPLSLQRELENIVLSRLGLRAGQWRLDTSPHAFASFQGRDDIRLTTRYPEAGLSLLTSLHEAGHGLYEHNIGRTLQQTPLAAGASAAFHESQSRLFENYIGRNVSFWRWLYPHVQRLVPDPFALIDLETYHRSLHVARPAPIRVGSDQVSYLLHIILRFEIELDLIEGRVEVPDLPELWNARTQTYLGVVADDDGRGVLQDVHWARGRFGYFPSYALGDVIAGQIWNRINSEVPEIDEQLSDGDLGPVCDWLSTNVWQHGSKFLPRELLMRIVGDDIDPRPHLDHLNRVFA